MFDFSSKTLDFGKKNIVINRKINLDDSLECFILISSSNSTLADNILNKILDLIIDKIGKEDSYSDFSLALQNINSFLKEWNKDAEKELKINIIIGILDENTFLFSDIGKVSCYLIKNNHELLEVTDKKFNKKQFGFISSGELNEGEIIVMGTHKLSNYLSNSDFLDGARLETLEDFNKNIVDILNGEIIEKNLGIISVKYNYIGSTKTKSNKFLFMKEFSIKLLDNNLTKKAIASYFIVKDKINKKSKSIKNVIFTLGILVSFFLLYSIVLNIVGNNNYIEKKMEYTQDLEKAKAFVVVASENINNPDLFNLNINNAEEIITIIKEEKLFSNDLSKMRDDISILKKQFNGVEIFDENSTNKIFVESIPGAIKTLKKDNKLYVVSQDSVMLLDSENLELQPFVFENLEDEEYFIDATVLVNDIVLLTNKSKIVTFNKGYFNFADVNGQKIWENSKNIESYGKNIYLLGQEDNQIYKHSKSGVRFNTALSYLKDEDAETIGNIKSIAIDGGIYILKDDLSMLKFFASPKYRLEKLTLNKLPKNYDIEDGNDNIEIKTRADLNYVYILLNNKIWIFKPNRKVYNDVKSLMYLGQIEGKNYEIIDFYPSHDGEIVVLNESGLYKLGFDVDEEDKIILR